MSKLVLAYCAGVVDSDGTIGVKRSTHGMRHGNGGQPTYSERVAVKQVEPHAVDVLFGLFGGHRRVDPPSAKGGRPLHAWTVTDRKAADCLDALLPYLRIKQRQALNCLALRTIKGKSARARVAFGRGHAGAARRPQELSDAMEATYARAKALNVVGERRV